MLIVPTAFQIPRGVLLVLIIFLSVTSNSKMYVPKVVGRWWLATFVISVISLTYSLIRGNPGAIPNVTIFFAWPLLYLYFMMRCNSINVIKKLQNTLLYGFFFVASFNFFMLLNEFYFHIGILSDIGEQLNCKYNVGITEGFFEYYTPSQSLLPYILYYIAASFILTKGNELKNKKILIICFFLSVIDILLSNRRGMWVVMGILPIFVLLLFYFSRGIRKSVNFAIIKKITIITIATFVFIGVIVMQFYDLDALSEEISSISDFSYNESNYERSMQAKSMAKDFYDSPLWGNGIGYVSEYVRTPDHPWEYELVYNYLLSSFGIIGFSVFIASLLWVYIKSFSISKNNKEYMILLMPQIAGLFSFLIINATNPYLLKFDFLWILYLPILTISTILKTNNLNKSNDYHLRNGEKDICILTIR